MATMAFTMHRQTKIERLHVRMTEDMARLVRARAEMNCRSIYDEIRWLILRGLETRATELCKEDWDEPRHRMSQPVTYGLNEDHG